jgi:AcrR family transcriptional regulator
MAGKKQLSERQSQIVQAALRIIATEGSRRFTAQTLAQEVGLTGGALYRHFPSMDAVVGAVVERVGELLFEGFPPQAADPIERLRLFFLRRARTIHGNPLVSRLLLSDHLAQAGGATQAKRLGEFKKRSQTFVAECLIEARRRGALAPDVSPRAGTVVFLGSVLALSHATPRVASPEEAEPLFEEVWACLERTLRGPVVARTADRPARPNRGPKP